MASVGQCPDFLSWDIFMWRPQDNSISGVPVVYIERIVFVVRMKNIHGLSVGAMNRARRGDVTRLLPATVVAVGVLAAKQSRSIRGEWRFAERQERCFFAKATIAVCVV